MSGHASPTRSTLAATIALLLLLTFALSACGAASATEGWPVLQLRVVVSSIHGSCPKSVPNPVPSKPLILRDPYGTNCVRLGLAGFVIGHAQAQVVAGVGPSVKISLNSDEGQSYQRFMNAHKGSTIATVALGTIQSAISMLDLFSGNFPFLVISMRSQSAARQLVESLSTVR